MKNISFKQNRCLVRQLYSTWSLTIENWFVVLIFTKKSDRHFSLNLPIGTANCISNWLVYNSLFIQIYPVNSRYWGDMTLGLSLVTGPIIFRLFLAKNHTKYILQNRSMKTSPHLASLTNKYETWIQPTQWSHCNVSVDTQCRELKKCKM